MTRGFRAVVEALAAQDGAQPPGQAADRGGQDAGLDGRRRERAAVGHGAAPRRAARSATRRRSTAPALADALDAALAGVVELGAAEPGDKTMVDALGPAAARAARARRGGRGARRRDRRGRRRGRGGRAGDGADAGPQGPRLVPRRALRRPPGPRRDVHGADRRRAGTRPRPAGADGRAGCSRASRRRPGEAVGRARHARARAGRRRDGACRATVPTALAAARAALAAAGAELDALAARLRAEGRADEAEIVETGVLMAADPALDAALEAAVLDRRPPAAPPRWSRPAASHADAIAALPDPTLAARADDVRSLGRRAAPPRRRARQPPRTGQAWHPVSAVVLVADDLGPADVAELDADVAGIALARRRAVGARRDRRARARAADGRSGSAPRCSRSPTATPLALDGAAGTLAVAPAAAPSVAAARGGPGAPRARARAASAAAALPVGHRRRPRASACSSTPPRAAEVRGRPAGGRRGRRPAAHRARRSSTRPRGRPRPRTARALEPVLAAARGPHRDRAGARLRRRQDAAVPARDARARARAAARARRRARRAAARDRRAPAPAPSCASCCRSSSPPSRSTPSARAAAPAATRRSAR